MADETEPDTTLDSGEVTTQPAISDAEAAQTDEVLSPVGDEKTVVVPVTESDVQLRSASLREIDMRIMPWGVVINSTDGTEEFARGAFDGIDPTKVMLIGPEHERQWALGHSGAPDLVRRPVGRGLALDSRDDGAYMTFRVARTAAGDEVLALITDGITPGVSIEFGEVPGGTQTTRRGGRRHLIQQRVALEAVTTTYRPAYQQAAVLAVRSQEREPVVTETVVAETIPQPATPALMDLAPVVEAIEAQGRTQAEQFRSFGERIMAIEESRRTDISIPGRTDGATQTRAMRGDWVQTVLRILSGERVADTQMRVMADLITSDNVGVVPDAFLTELIGVIDPARPFLNSTRKLDLPAAGMSLIVPKIVTRPTTGIQAAEKDDITSTTTSITNATFDAMTIAGGGDISLQLLKRSSPSYLSLYLELLAESYAHNAEIEGIQALLASGVSSGGALDPEDANFGAAWVNGAAVRKPPNTIWLSSEGVGKFIDAKASGTNAPLYSNIQAGFTAGAGPAGTISGLRPVYVPELDLASATIDAIVGPSSGFGWTEDGTYTLQVDVPAKAGRDVAIAGILWFAPMYPTAFTVYTIAS